MSTTTLVLGHSSRFVTISTTPGGRRKKHIDMEERFFDLRLLVTLPTISRKHAHVKNDVVGIADHFFAGVQCVSGVGVRYCVVYLPLDDLDAVSVGLRLSKTIAVRDSVCVHNHGKSCVQVGK